MNYGDLMSLERYVGSPLSQSGCGLSHGSSLGTRNMKAMDHVIWVKSSPRKGNPERLVHNH